MRSLGHEEPGSWARKGSGTHGPVDGGEFGSQGRGRGVRMPEEGNCGVWGQEKKPTRILEARGEAREELRGKKKGPKSSRRPDKRLRRN